MVRTQPDDDSDVRLLANIDEHGWHVVGIPEDEDGPGYAFTVGLNHTYGVSELCVFGLPDVYTMMHIVNTAADLFIEGAEIDDWYASDEVLEEDSVIFRRVEPTHYPQYFGTACWFYEGIEFPMLQIFWPYVDGLFPWSSETGGSTSAVQPVLSADSAWPFRQAKNTAVFVTRPVLEDGHPILGIVHDEDGDWQFLCGTTVDPDDCLLVSLESVLQGWPGIRQVSHLPPGSLVTRDSPDNSWPAPDH